LGTYAVTASTTNSVSFRPSSYAELSLLNTSAGLTVDIAPSGSGQSPIIEFSAFKIVTGFLKAPGSNNLVLNLNTNSLAQSPSYSVEFLDSSRNVLQTLTGVTASNSTLTVDLSSLQASVASAYDGGGIYVSLTNSQNQSLPGAYYTNANDIGALNDFYDGTQLQGQLALAGQGLVNVQKDLGFLSSPNVDVPYVARFATEIPFAHTLSITRLLGGYTQASVEQICGNSIGTTSFASSCAPVSEPWSLDYVVKAGSTFSYQTPLMLDRISPYIAAGYSPGDMTLVLINVPWALSSDAAPQNGSACVPQSTGGSLGTWGQCNPPASYAQWGVAIARLATDLQGSYQAGAANFTFEIGDEYDQSSTFNGQSSDFYDLYETAYKSIKSVLPAAPVVAGDFTAACYASASTNAAGCVYDSKAFLSREIGLGDAPPNLNRSLNMFWDTTPTPYPSAAVSGAATSVVYVTGAATNQLPLQIHQFGFLHMPWGSVGSNGGTSVASVEANWEFQALMGLKQNLPNLSRVFNWGGFATINDGVSLNFLEGAGYIRTIMDNHQGAELYMLPVTAGNLPAGNEVLAVAMVEGNSFQIIVSNVDVVPVNSNLATLQPDAPAKLSITIPAAWLGTTNWSYLRYSSALVDNVFAQVKRDYAAAGILDANFAQCAICFSDPITMTTNQAAAETLLVNNWTSSSNYVQTMQNTLKWNSVTSLNSSKQLNIDQNGVTHAFSQSGGTLTVTIGANEMLVLNPN